MALTTQDFKTLPSSGVIPADRAPASEFAVSYEFIATAEASGNNPNKSFSTHVTLKVWSAQSTLRYTIDIYETYNVFIFSLGSGLVLYTWNWVPTEEKIVGVRADGSAMTTLGLSTFGVDPAEDSGTTDREVIVGSRFYSDIFTEPLEAGDVIKITFHNASAGYATDTASLAVATLAGGRLPGLFDSRCGQQFRALVSDNQVRVIRSRKTSSPLIQSDAEWGLFSESEPGVASAQALQNMALARGPGDATYLLGRTTNLFKLFRTFDEGETWEPLMTTANTVSPLASCLSKDGSTFFIYGVGSDKKPAYTILKNESDGWKLSETGPCEGKDLPTATVNSLELSDGGLLRLLATQSGGALLFFSSSDGKTYSQEKVN